jgi:organic hydroperoxide reductase OsmC/OhrA
VPGVDAAEFERHVEASKENCPVSRALAVDISVEATIEG